MDEPKDETVPFEILLAEDEPAIREGLVLLFESEGYAVRAVADGEAALAEFRRRRPGLLLLDVMMPKRNGFAVCSEVRACDASVPILFLTAKADDVDQLRGLSLGADDYIPKTASQPVLLARIAAVARRARLAPPDETSRACFAFGGCTVDPVNFRLRSSDGTAQDLSVNEVEILRCLASYPNETFTRDYLLTKGWGALCDIDENNLSVAICRLRRKLGVDGDRIQTVHRRGYRFRG